MSIHSEVGDEVHRGKTAICRTATVPSGLLVVRCEARYEARRSGYKGRQSGASVRIGYASVPWRRMSSMNGEETVGSEVLCRARPRRHYWQCRRHCGAMSLCCVLGHCIQLGHRPLGKIWCMRCSLTSTAARMSLRRTRSSPRHQTNCRDVTIRRSTGAAFTYACLVATRTSPARRHGQYSMAGRCARRLMWSRRQAVLLRGPP